MTDGTDVRIRGRLDWYSPRGQLQLRMTAIDPAYTLGQLELARAELLARLPAEGLLGANAGRALPLAPLRVGLVTSEGSAAEADFLDELRRSGFAFHVLRVDTRVQGSTRPGRSRRRSACWPPTRSTCSPSCAAAAPAPTWPPSTTKPWRAPSRPAPCPCSRASATRSTPRSPTRSPTPSAKTPTACAQLLVARVARRSPARLEGTLGRHRRARACARCARHDERLRRPRPPPGARAPGSPSIGSDARLAVDRRPLPPRRAWPASTRRAAASTATAGRITGAARSHLRAAEVLVAAGERRIAHRAPRALSEAERALAAVDARLRALDPDRTLARGWSITRGPDGGCVRSPDRGRRPATRSPPVARRRRASRSTVSPDA